MEVNTVNLTLALYAEHKQRTGHDVQAEGRWSDLYIRCDVCLWLKGLMDAAEAMQCAAQEPKREGEAQ